MEKTAINALTQATNRLSFEVDSSSDLKDDDHVSLWKDTSSNSPLQPTLK